MILSAFELALWGKDSIEGWLTSVLKNVQAAGFAVDGVNQAVLIHDGVIYGDGVGGVVGWRWRNEVADFFDTRRRVCHSGKIHQAKDANSAVEESCHRAVLQLCRSRARKVGA